MRRSNVTGFGGVGGGNWALLSRFSWDGDVAQVRASAKATKPIKAINDRTQVGLALRHAGLMWVLAGHGKAKRSQLPVARLRAPRAVEDFSRSACETGAREGAARCPR
jgi:hypothetical protein